LDRSREGIRFEISDFGFEISVRPISAKVPTRNSRTMSSFFDISWWGWMLFGILLALLELASPGGFYFIFFGVSAVVVGLLTWLGLTVEPWVEITLFSIFSILASVLFRKRLLARFGPKAPDVPVDSLVGETATALDEIQASSFGKVELRGSAWNARNSGDAALSRGQRCRVERVDGLSLWVKAE
jgi:membrane protein implicated in regulation of membrane protease activity